MNYLKLFVIILFVFEYTNTSAQLSWIQKQAAPDTRYEGVSFAAGDYIYYGLGHNVSLGYSDNKFYRFDPVSNTWDTIAAFPGTPRRLASAFSVAEKGYVCFGVDPVTTLQLNDLWQYDPALNVWNQKASLPANGWLAGTATATATKGYAGLGLHDHSSGFLNLTWWEYDPVPDQWNQKASMPGVGLYQTNSFCTGDSIYVVCGMGTNLIIPTREFWLYDITSNTWTQQPDYPGDARTSISAFAINGKGYAGYGLGNGAQDLFGDFYSYESSTGMWTAESSCATALFDASCATAAAGYVINNTSWNSSSHDVWEYGPSGTGIQITLPAEPEIVITTLKNEWILKSAFAADCRLISPEGRIIFRFRITPGKEVSISQNSLTSGIYFFSASGERTITIQKLILSK